jgi:hypothetical protein
MRRPLLLGPPEVSWEMVGIVLTEDGFRKLNESVVFPIARLLKLYHMACGEKLAIVPRMTIEIVHYVKLDPLWPLFYDHIFRLWNEGLVFDFMFITVRKSSTKKPSELVASEKMITMENHTWVQ